MVTQSQKREILGKLQSDAPAGYALAFHVKFTTPTYLFQTYRPDWLEYYAQNGFLMQDPTVAWGFQNLGTERWSVLADGDTGGVLSKASEYGMSFGATVAIEVQGKRSLGSFARPDREFSDQEISSFEESMHELHMLLDEAESLSPETAAELRRMSVIVTHP